MDAANQEVHDDGHHVLWAVDAASVDVEEEHTCSSVIGVGPYRVCLSVGHCVEHLHRCQAGAIDVERTFPHNEGAQLECVLAEAVLLVLALIFVVGGVHVSDEESCGPKTQDFESLPTLEEIGDPVRL